jgi:16S rRNA (adenine(1408)-N(1))-methyltransferase
VAEPLDNSKPRNSKTLSIPTGEGIIIDIGTGDGTFVYHCARLNPGKFVIGIDPNTRPLQKISEKIYRKPDKGGLPNALFLQAAVEDLPEELNGVADEIHVHFPWGNLLGALVGGDLNVLKGLRKICSDGALLEVVTGLDEDRDRTELERLGISDFSISHIKQVLTPLYLEAGFKITECGNLPPSHWPKLHTSWAKRLKHSSTRSLTYVVAEAI